MIYVLAQHSLTVEIPLIQREKRKINFNSKETYTDVGFNKQEKYSTLKMWF